MSGRPPKRRILIVGEGRETEYNYFVGLRNASESILAQKMTSVSVARGKGGDARGIVKHAFKEKQRFKPKVKLGDRVFLILDTEGAGRAPELPAAEKLAKKHKIEIIYSSPAIEYWFLCHFPNCPRRHFEKCDDVIVELNKRWPEVCKSDYDKADRDIFERLAAKLEVARKEALAIDIFNIGLLDEHRRINPSTQVYELVALILGAKTGEKCPVSGNWKLVGKPTIVIALNKGDAIPMHDGSPSHWHL